MPFIVHNKHNYHPSWHHAAISKLMEALHFGWTPRQFLRWCGLSDTDIRRGITRPHEVTKLYLGMTRPDMLDDPIRNAQVWVSPRAGKTEIVSRNAPAWWLGRNRDARILGTSFGDKFAQQVSRDVQRVIDTPAYREVFPLTRLQGKDVIGFADGKYQRNAEIFEVVNARGFYKSAGVGGGGLMGRGGDLAIVDDFYRSRKQAESPVERLTVWEWYNSTLYSRLEKDARRLICCTRWRSDDLSSLVNEAAAADPTAEQYFCLVFPAILDCAPGPGDPRRQGEALWPEKYPLKKLLQIKASMGSYEFEALHQQRPSPRGGGVVQESWWRFYDVLPEGLTDYTISVDLSFKDRGDFSAFQVWAKHGANRYLIDQVHGRKTFTEQLRTMLALCAKYPEAQTKLVEDAANGAALIDTLRNKISGIVAVPARNSKSLRVDAVSPQIEAGNVFLPTKRIAPYIDGFISEFNFFPNGAHDDMVDCAVQALWHLRQRDFDYDFSVLGVSKQSAWL